MAPQVELAVLAIVVCLLAVGFAGARPVLAQTSQGAQPDAMHGMHDSAHSQAPAAAAAPAVPPVQALRAAINFSLGQAQQELMSLAEAMPAEKYTWRPGEGVRSVGEVYMHVATANYMLPTFWGVQPPAGVDRHGLEKLGGDKAKTVATLKESFEHVRQAIDGLSDADLGKSVTLFGHPTTVAGAVLVVVGHAHEHLGQSIAYARSNGVVPPWSVPEKPPGR
jgi:uncharacterized damage-inducible protein DinB